MNRDYLKLTAYFGERQRADGRFLAEAMFELYGRRRVATSVMLRGIGGFGARHQLRTDESLSLSEDPPVAVAAVDTHAKIQDLVDDVVAMTPRGVVTLERARMVDGAVTMPDAVKVTVYVGRQQRVSGRPAYQAVCEVLHRHRFSGAAVFLGVDGTAHGERHRARFFSPNVNVPLMIIGIGSGECAAAAIPELWAMLGDPLLTVERVRLCKRDGELLARPDALPEVDDHGLGIWQKLMVYTSEADTADGLPIHRALIRRLRQSRTASGATALRGIWGFQGPQKPHGDKLIQLSRRVPVATIIVDTPDSIARSFDIVDELTGRHGVVTCEMVPAVLTIDGDRRYGGTRLARYHY